MRSELQALLQINAPGCPTQETGAAETGRENGQATATAALAQEAVQERTAAICFWQMKKGSPALLVKGQ